MGIGSLLGKIAGVAAAPMTGGTSLLPMALGAAAGAGKHFLVDKPNQKKSAELSAEIMRYSPWTGMQAPGIKYAPGLFSSALQGGAMGAMAGQAMGGAGAAAAAPDVSALQGGGMMSPMAGNVKPWFGMQPSNPVPLR
jgi:hypothetical protein